MQFQPPALEDLEAPRRQTSLDGEAIKIIIHDVDSGPFLASKRRVTLRRDPTDKAHRSNAFYTILFYRSHFYSQIEFAFFFVVVVLLCVHKQHEALECVLLVEKLVLMVDYLRISFGRYLVDRRKKWAYNKEIK